MATPGSAEWMRQFYGPGWPDCSSSNKVLIDFCGHQLSFHKVCARHFKWLAREFEEKTPAYARKISNRPDTGSYNCRAISGTTVASNHSFGSAVDVVWQENGRDGDGTFLDSSVWNEARAVVLSAENHGLRWGGRYSEPDPMHFEELMTPAEVKARFTRSGFDRNETTFVIRAQKRVKRVVRRSRDRVKKVAARLRKRGFKVDVRKRP